MSVPEPAVVEVTNLFPLASISPPITCTVPVAEILNCVEELTSKFTKSPLYPDAGFDPKDVPDGLPPVMKFDPIRTRVEVVD